LGKKHGEKSGKNWVKIEQGKNVRTKVSRNVVKKVQGKRLGENFGRKKCGKKRGKSWRQKLKVKSFFFFVSQKFLPTSFKIFPPIIIGTNGRIFTPEFLVIQPRNQN